MKQIFLIIVSALFLECYLCSIYCPDDFCNTVKCANAICKDDEKLSETGGVCNCCPICVKQIQPGEDCSLTMLLGGPRQAECTEGHRCDFDTRKCVLVEMPACHKYLKEQEGNNLMGVFRPKCTSAGFYAPVQCHGSGCYCASKTGEEIKDYKFHITKSAQANCKCAREQHEYSKTGLLGKMFSCDDLGNYHKVQCSGSVCYCADEDGKQKEGDQGVHIAQSKDLQC